MARCLHMRGPWMENRRKFGSRVRGMTAVTLFGPARGFLGEFLRGIVSGGYGPVNT